MKYEDVPDWDGAVQVLRGSDSIAIACHVNPDGDAMGSLLGASLGLRKIGKQTHPTWGTTPLTVPVTYAFLPGSDTIVQSDALPETTTFLALDCGAADRLGDVETVAKKATHLINIDHHPGNEDFGTHNLVVTTASSTAELVAQLLYDLDIEIDRDIATCLYTGIVTDTGRFQYSNSSPHALRLAANLLAYGVPAPEIAREIYESSPFGYMKLSGRVLDRAVLDEDARFVYSWFTLDDLKETNVAIEETDQLIDLIRTTRAADVAAMFKQQRDGSWRVSLRSKGPSVGALARARGGGGHELAAGFTAVDRDAMARELAGELKGTPA